MKMTDTPENVKVGFTDVAASDQSDISRVGTRSLFLGIDGGGTKTRAVLIDSAAAVQGEGASGGSNPVRVGFDEAIHNVRTAADEAYANSSAKSSDVVSACIAIAGISHPIHFNAMKAALTVILPFSFELVTDAEAALVGALDGKPGVVVIAGTGSIAIGVNESGMEARAGGWGPVISDEGSGYDIARRALRAVAAAFDGRAPATSLTELLLSRLGIANAAELPGVIYKQGLPEPVEIAPLAELVSEAAHSGDKQAIAILEVAGRELARLAISVIRRLDMQATQLDVACVGSVFNAGEPLVEPLRGSITAIASGARVGPGRFPPAIGAAKIALARFHERS